MRADRGVHLHRHLGPCLAGQRDQPVDSRSPAARVALRHLPHADQRIAPAPQREFLQAPGQWPVTLLDRLEDPAAQPPYLLLMVPPVSSFPGVTVERGQALRSVHRGVQLAHQFRHLRSLSPQRLTCPRQRSFEPGSKTGIRASYTRTLREEFPVPRSRFPAAFRPPGIRFLGTLSCQGIQPPLRSAYRTACAYPRLGYGPIAGFTRSARVRPGPGRPPSIPRGQRCPHGQGASPAAACRISAACPCHPGRTTQPRTYASRGISKGFLVVALFRSFPAPVATMAGAAALGLFRKLRTRPVRNRPRTSRRGQVEHHLLLCLRHQPDLLDQHTHHVRPRVATLTTCDRCRNTRRSPPTPARSRSRRQKTPWSRSFPRGRCTRRAAAPRTRWRPPSSAARSRRSRCPGRSGPPRHPGSTPPPARAAPPAGPSSPTGTSRAGPASGPTPHDQPIPPAPSSSPWSPAPAPPRNPTPPPRCAAAPSPVPGRSEEHTSE